MKLLGHGPRGTLRLPVIACAALAAAACSSSSSSTSTAGSTGTASGASSGAGVSSTSGAATGVTGASSGVGASSGAVTGATGTGSGSGATGASSGASNGSSGTTSGVVSSLTPVANKGFTSPFDAVDDGDGNVYFTAISPAGTSDVFTTQDDGSTASSPSDLAVTGLTAGLGIAISSDGNTLYIADPGAETDTFGTGGNITGTTLGQVVSVGFGGGAASPLTGTQGYVPVGVAILGATGSGADTLYFTGQDPTNSKWGIFSITAAGTGTPTVIAEGTPFVNPSGVLITTDNTGAASTAYVVDRGRVISVTPAGVATVLASGLSIGFPGGIGISGDSTTLLVSSIDPSVGNDGVAQVLIATGAVSYALSGASGFGPKLIEPGGLQGSGNGTAYVFVDGLAGGTGAVYTLQ